MSVSRLGLSCGGSLISEPHTEEAFPKLQKQDLSLEPITAVEHTDPIWVLITKASTIERIQAHPSRFHRTESGSIWLDCRSPRKRKSR